ncbi:hypothetical protein LJR230_001587 [Trinickia sp. LjRoot230]|uniref:hypothetical protein n=1 Tax=Trinickia sp. LjRoot230 TaxID=3342288 RepID=UPI003ED0543C
MDLPSLALLAVVALGIGGAITYLMAQWQDATVANLAAEHGRFVGLGEVERFGMPAAPLGRRTQHEALNVIRTAN